MGKDKTLRGASKKSRLRRRQETGVETNHRDKIWDGIRGVDEKGEKRTGGKGGFKGKREERESEGPFRGSFFFFLFFFCFFFFFLIFFRQLMAPKLRN